LKKEHNISNLETLDLHWVCENGKAPTQIWTEVKSCKTLRAQASERWLEEGFVKINSKDGVTVSCKEWIVDWSHNFSLAAESRSELGGV